MIVRATLVAEGPSDQALIPIIDAIGRSVGVPIETTWADLRRCRQPTRTLPARLQAAADLYPAHVLIVHRDADRAGYDARLVEIERATLETDLRVTVLPAIPVRATEAWLLASETAIRRAAGNPEGTMPLGLPTPREAERSADPKAKLRDALLTASGTTGRRRRKFDAGWARQLVARYLADEGLSALRDLASFRRFEKQLLERVAAR